MTSDIYDDFALERLIKDRFGFDMGIHKVIVRQIPVGPSVEATIILTDKKQLLAFIGGQSKLLLGDVKKIVSRLGLKAELYIPPKNQPDYFDAVGRAKFREVFPGRGHITDEDIVFYRTLAPYSPALVLIAEVKDGHIYQYDRDTRGGWRVATKFAYRRIKTS